MLHVQLLCASNEAHDKVEPVLVPEGVEAGERVSFEGFEGPPEPVLNPKKKLWEKIAPDLATNAGVHQTLSSLFLCSASARGRIQIGWCNICIRKVCTDLTAAMCSPVNEYVWLLCAEGIAVYKNIPFMTSQGPITSSLPNAVVR